VAPESTISGEKYEDDVPMSGGCGYETDWVGVATGIRGLGRVCARKTWTASGVTWGTLFMNGATRKTVVGFAVTDDASSIEGVGCGESLGEQLIDR